MMFTRCFFTSLTVIEIGASGGPENDKEFLVSWCKVSVVFVKTVKSIGGAHQETLFPSHVS